jgi:hypothetical protein
VIAKAHMNLRLGELKRIYGANLLTVSYLYVKHS